MGPLHTVFCGLSKSKSIYKYGVSRHTPGQAPRRSWLGSGACPGGPGGVGLLRRHSGSRLGCRVGRQAGRRPSRHLRRGTGRGPNSRPGRLLRRRAGRKACVPVGVQAVVQVGGSGRRAGVKQPGKQASGKASQP